MAISAFSQKGGSGCRRVGRIEDGADHGNGISGKLVSIGGIDTAKCHDGQWGGIGQLPETFDTKMRGAGMTGGREHRREQGEIGAGCVRFGQLLG